MFIKVMCFIMKVVKEKARYYVSINNKEIGGKYMQRYILGKKNQITLISAILIVLGFYGHFGLDNVMLSNWSLIIASVLGIAPIAIQAYQALKVKVVSIDVLVTIVVVGALLIQNYEVSAIVTFLFLFGAYLEQRTLNKTRSAIRELTEMAPEI